MAALWLKSRLTIFCATAHISPIFRQALTPIKLRVAMVKLKALSNVTMDVSMDGSGEGIDHTTRVRFLEMGARTSARSKPDTRAGVSLVFAVPPVSRAHTELGVRLQAPKTSVRVLYARLENTRISVVNSMTIAGIVSPTPMERVTIRSRGR